MNDALFVQDLQAILTVQAPSQPTLLVLSRSQKSTSNSSNSQLSSIHHTSWNLDSILNNSLLHAEEQDQYGSSLRRTSWIGITQTYTYETFVNNLKQPLC